MTWNNIRILSIQVLKNGRPKVALLTRFIVFPCCEPILFYVGLIPLLRAYTVLCKLHSFAASLYGFMQM
jgi:hypothetical protein